MHANSAASAEARYTSPTELQKLWRCIKERRMPVRAKRLVPQLLGKISNETVVYSKHGRRSFLKFDLRGMSRANEILDEVFTARVYFPTLDARTTFEIARGDTVIDIGANIGLFGACAANLSRTGQVYCFEPSRTNFQRLELHRRRNGLDNMVLINKAVSDKQETAKLYLLDENCGAHTTMPDRGDGLRFAPDEYEMVECIPLQQLFDAGIDRCHFLKIDCEGAEMKILAALPADYFRRIDRIALEYHANVDVLELAGLLHSHGFSVVIKGFPMRWGMLFAFRQ
jgi:FkbM family methyltransferase